MKKENYGYGPHLMLDLNECDSAILNNLELCFNFLNELPPKINMTKITQPYLFRYSNPDTDNEGLTGFVIIAESHISIHTYPKKNYVFVDLFSCKPFDTDEAKNYIVEYFKSKSYKSYLEVRGQDFP
jgi:S-adenosylmethionine decarboxylase